MDELQANPLWPVETRFPVLDRDQRVDVVIVGAGIAGISCAFHLQNSGYRVAVIDREEVGSAATGASSGILYYGSGGNFVEAVQRYGKTDAATLWKETERTISDIVKLVEKDRIECGFRHTGAIMVAKDESEKSRIEREHDLLAEVGIRTDQCSGADIQQSFTGSPFVSGLLFNVCCVLHPAQFGAGLARKFNIPVYERSPMVEFTVKGDHVAVQSSRAKILCDRLILATNLEPVCGLEKHFTREDTVVLASHESQETGTVWPEDRVIWGMEEKYDILYPLGRRMALELYEPKNIEQKIASYYRGVKFEIEHRWGESWSKTSDLLPIAGQVGNRVHVAVAMGDEGIVMGFTIGSRMPLAFENRGDEILRMTSPSRFSQTMVSQ